MRPSDAPTSLQLRSFQFRAETDAGDERTITGIGVPYNDEIEYVPGFFESFDPGSVNDEGAILRYAHRDPLGPIPAAQDTPEGRKITAKISDTAQGRDIATLVRDGVLTKLSIGFYPEQYTDEERADGVHRRYHSVRAVEYSIVEFPAYDAADITDYRSKPTTTQGEPMTPTDTPDLREDLRAELRALSDSFDDFEREIRARVSDALAPADSVAAEFRSIGEYAKALALVGHDKHAAAERAFSGAVVGDAPKRPAWLGVLDKRMTAKTPVTNLFLHTMDLPAEGMTVEYAVRAAKTGVKVSKQAAEGDALATGKPAAYSVKSAAVATFGGVGTMSFQAIERASVSLLDDLLSDQAMIYATEIEAATRALFEEQVTTAEGSPAHTFASLAGSTVDDWTDFALALIDLYDQTPYVLDGIAVSGDVFARLAKMPRDPKALQFTGAPTDHQGTITIQTGSADFSTLTVQRIPNWNGAHAVGYSREAIRIKEAPGAPLRLQDSNILDLTKAFAVYGYAAHFAPHPELLKAAKFTA